MPNVQRSRELVTQRGFNDLPLDSGPIQDMGRPGERSFDKLIKTYLHSTYNGRKASH